MSVFLIKMLQLLLSLAILVFIHELGHFLFAKLFKIRVNKFYLFFDPWFALFKYKPKNSETEYGIGWLPLGGYCQIAGMVDESMNTDGLESEPEEWEFRAKPTWQRLLVMLGGVLFNLILAIAIYSGIAYTWGEQKIPMKNIGTNLSYSSVGHRMGLQDGDLPIAVDGKEIKYFDEKTMPMIADGHMLTVVRDGAETMIEIPVDLMRAMIASDSALYTLQMPAVIDRVLGNSEGAKAGFKSGDRIVAVQGEALAGLNEIVEKIATMRGDSATLLVQRAGKPVTLRTFVHKSDGIGIAFMPPQEIFGIEHVKYGFFESIPAGIRTSFSRLSSYTSSLKYVATKEGASKLGGLGSIGSLFPSSFSWFEFWTMTAFLSVILAVMNILPIPGLDGGHIMFLLWEMITGRKLSVKTQERIQLAGMIFLILLMLYANLNDVRRFLF